MTYSKQTRIFLGVLAATVLSVVAYDAWRPPEPMAGGAPTQVPVEAPPPQRRVLDKTPLLYEAEFLQNLLTRLRPSLVSAHPEPDTFAVTTNGFVVGPGLVLVSLVSDAANWRLHTADGDVADGVLVGLDRVHGLALLRTTLDSAQPLPFASGMALSAVEPLIAVQANATGGEVRMLLKAGSVSAFDQVLAPAGLRAGEVALDADGRLRAFGAATEAGVRPLFVFEVGEIAAALSTSALHEHPWLGTTLQTLDEGLGPWFGEGGFVVVHVEPGSPAARAGLKAGAVFAEARLGDRVARTADGVDNMIAVGETIAFLPVPRGRAAPKPIAVEVADRQHALPAQTYDVASLGLMPAEVLPGVAIVVAPGGAASARGLLTGDVVEAVDLQAVASARTLQRALSARSSKGGHLATVRRGGDRFFVLLGPSEVTAAPGAGGGDE